MRSTISASVGKCFAASWCTMTEKRRRAMRCVTSLLLLGLCVRLDQTQAADVDLNHIADLSAEIDLRKSYTAWIQGNQPLPASLPHTASTSPLFHQPPYAPLSPLQARHHQDTGRPSPPRVPSPGSGGPESPGSAPHYARHTLSHSGESRNSPLPTRVPATGLSAATASGERGGERSAGKSKPLSLEEIFEKAKETSLARAKMMTTTPLPPKLKPLGLSSEVVHMSAKKLSKMEEDLAKRLQTEPEHKLYNQELLIRRLKTLRQDQRRAAVGKRPLPGAEKAMEEEEEDWQQELRIRSELADKALQYGLQKKKERLEHPPESAKDLSVLERIRQDAEEILRRRALEREYMKRMHRGKSYTPPRSGSQDKDQTDKGTPSTGGVSGSVDDHGQSGAERSPMLADREKAGASSGEGPVAVNSPVSVLGVPPALGPRPPPANNPTISRKNKKRSRALVRTLNKQNRL